MMRSHIVFFGSFFLFFFLFFGLDFLCSLIIKTDQNLSFQNVSEIEYEALKKEYDALMTSENFALTLEEKPIITKVVSHDPYIFFEEVTILKGKYENIEVGDVVYNELGYIGKVVDVKDHHSIVRLFTNRDNTIQVKIQNSYGIFQKDINQFVVKNITSKEPITEGSIVYTSNYSEIPFEMPLAKVTKVETSSIEQTLIVTPLIKVEELNYCYIRKAKI